MPRVRPLVPPEIPPRRETRMALNAFEWTLARVFATVDCMRRRIVKTVFKVEGDSALTDEISLGRESCLTLFALEWAGVRPAVG